MNLQDALTLFRRLGIDPEYLSLQEFKAAYYRLALRYHPDRNPKSGELMASINAARTEVIKTYLPHRQG